jgi:Flp pilus assembly pilin Flp
MKAKALQIRDETGQTMAEYAVVLAVITLVTVAVFISLGNSIEGAINVVRTTLFP